MASKYLSLTGLGYYTDRIKALFVAKETGKGLSANDYTNEDKAEVAKIAELVATGGEPNTIATVKLDGTALTPDAQKAVNIPFTIVRDNEEKKTTFTFDGKSAGSSLEVKLNTNIAGYAYDFTEINHDSGSETVVTLASLDSADAQVTVKSVKVNGTALTPDAQRAVDVQVATLTDTNSSNLHTATIAAARASNGEQYQLSFADTSNGLTAKYQQPNGESRATFFEKAIPDETRVNALIAAAVTAGVGEITGFEYEVVASLPATGEKGVIYLVPNSGSNPNVKDEYIWINKGTAESPDYAFELLGTTELDLSGYLQTTDIEAITTAEIDEITGATPTPTP